MATSREFNITSLSVYRPNSSSSSNNNSEENVVASRNVDHHLQCQLYTTEIHAEVSLLVYSAIGLSQLVIILPLSDRITRAYR